MLHEALGDVLYFRPSELEEKKHVTINGSVFVKSEPGARYFNVRVASGLQKRICVHTLKHLLWPLNVL
jgi:hypothetical protein